MAIISSTKSRLLLLFIIGLVLGVYLLLQPVWQKNSENKFPRDYEINFAKSCMESGASETSCSCSLTYIESHYTYDEAKKLDNQAEQNKLPAEVNKAFTDCRKF